MKKLLLTAILTLSVFAQAKEYVCDDLSKQNTAEPVLVIENQDKSISAYQTQKGLGTIEVEVGGQKYLANEIFANANNRAPNANEIMVSVAKSSMFGLDGSSRNSIMINLAGEAIYVHDGRSSSLSLTGSAASVFSRNMKCVDKSVQAEESK